MRSRWPRGVTAGSRTKGRSLPVAGSTTLATLRSSESRSRWLAASRSRYSSCSSQEPLATLPSKLSVRSRERCFGRTACGLPKEWGSGGAGAAPSAKSVATRARLMPSPSYRGALGAAPVRPPFQHVFPRIVGDPLGDALGGDLVENVAPGPQDRPCVGGEAMALVADTVRQPLMVEARRVDGLLDVHALVHHP